MSKRPTARMPPPDIKGSKVRFTEARQNPANDWQQWLRAGVLCRLKQNMYLSRKTTRGVVYAFSSPHRRIDAAIALAGEYVFCLGEASRSKRPDPENPRRMIVHVEYEFLFATGIFVADPRSVEECDGDSVV